MNQKQIKHLEDRIATVRRTARNIDSRDAMPVEVKRARAIVDKYVAAQHKKDKEFQARIRKEIQKVEVDILFGTPETALPLLEKLEAKVASLNKD